MSKFNLTKQMKAKLALELTVLAVKKNIPPIEKAVKAINQKFWDAHIKRTETETGLSADKFPRLIQLGIMAGAVFGEPTCLVDGSNKTFSLVFQKSGFTDKHTLQATLMHEQAFRGLREHFHVLCNRGADRLTFLFRTEHTVPRFSQMQDLTDRPELVAEIHDVCERLMKLLNAAAEFHEQTEMVLLPMRTSTQLLDAFPEAAKLLPEPVKTTHELAPIDQINRVREMLKAGVPQPEVRVC